MVNSRRRRKTVENWPTRENYRWMELNKIKTMHNHSTSSILHRSVCFSIEKRSSYFNQHESLRASISRSDIRTDSLQRETKMVEFYDTQMHVYACFCHPLEQLFHCLSWLRMTSFLFSIERNDATRWLHSYRWHCIIQRTYGESTISNDECAVLSLNFVSRGHVMEL